MFLDPHQNSSLSVSIANSIFQTNQGTLIFTYGLIKDAITYNCSFKDNKPNPALGRLIQIDILSGINISSNNFTSNRGALINLDTEDNKGITCSLENLYFYNNIADQTLVSITSINISLISTNFAANLRSLFNSETASVISVTNSSIVIKTVFL